MRRLAYCTLGMAVASLTPSLRAAPAPAPAGEVPQERPSTPPQPAVPPPPAPPGDEEPQQPATETAPPAEEGQPAAPSAAEPKPSPPAPPPRRSGSVSRAELGDFADVEEEEETPPVIPPAADMRSGHFVAALGGALLIPFGTVEDGASTGDLGVGGAITLDLGIGISRMTVLALSGQYGLLGRGDECADCEPSTWAVGALLRYHLVQGLRFDPWMAGGIGVRGVHFDSARSYVGVDWVKLQVGGDWYPWSSVGFGPFAEFDFGSALKASEGDLQDPGLVVHALFGIRVVLDVPGK